jgi:hypothetical protein
MQNNAAINPHREAPDFGRFGAIRSATLWRGDHVVDLQAPDHRYARHGGGIRSFSLLKFHSGIGG